MYNRFKTAITRNKISRPVQYLLDHNHLYGKILDYGCGKGFDVDALNEKGFHVTGYDLFNPMYNNTEVLREFYDVAICTYVLNVIDSQHEIDEVINLLQYIASEVFISVRADTQNIKESWKWDSELLGHWTTAGTFQRFFHGHELMDYSEKSKLIHSENDFLIIKL